VVSPDILPDQRVVFRLRAPNVREVWPWLRRYFAEFAEVAFQGD